MKLTESKLRTIIKEELKKLLNEEDGVTFTVKQHVKSHYGVGVVETVGTYKSYEEAVEVAKKGDRYIVSSKGEQFYPKHNF